MIWLFALLLVVWGNLVSSLLGATAVLPGGSFAFAVAGAALIAISLAAARALGLDAAGVGLGRDGLGRGALVGTGIGLVGAIVAVGALRLVAPAIVGRQVEYAPLAQVSEVELARHVAVFLPLGAIIPEELAFRGVLLGGLQRLLGQRDALVVSGAAFSLWHIAVAVVTVGDTTLRAPSLWFVPAIVAALAVVLVGGTALAWLRVRTGSLATTIALHWVFNTGLLIGLWSTRGPVSGVCC